MNLDVSRSRFNDLQKKSEGKDWKLAELLIVEDGDLVHENDDPWWDARNPRTDAKHEVKSVTEEIDGRDKDAYVPTPGRIRLWEDQTRSLNAYDADQTGWIDFLLLDEQGTPQDHVRRKPGTILSLVNELGGWDDSGHSKGRQKKIPFPVIFDDV